MPDMSELVEDPFVAASLDRLGDHVESLLLIGEQLQHTIRSLERERRAILAHHGLEGER
jgi:hypothetical protein